LAKTRQSVVGSAVGLLLIVLCALGLAFGVQAFLIKPYRIPSASMEPTLDINQRILVNRLAMTIGSPKVGQILVFHPPRNYGVCADPNQGNDAIGEPDAQACDVAQASDASVTFVKRVVGLPGDHLSIRDGRVFRNGKPESNRQTISCDGVATCNFPRTIVVPKGDYYMMGDNRPNSDDSRFWGPVRRSWLIGQVIFSYWPPDRLGTL
jgi:signal peptidase I